jgi:hypothetical protein
VSSPGSCNWSSRYGDKIGHPTTPQYRGLPQFFTIIGSAVTAVPVARRATGDNDLAGLQARQLPLNQRKKT